MQSHIELGFSQEKAVADSAEARAKQDLGLQNPPANTRATGLLACKHTPVEDNDASTQADLKGP